MTWNHPTALEQAASLIHGYIDSGGQDHEVVRADRILQALLREQRTRDALDAIQARLAPGGEVEQRVDARARERARRDEAIMNLVTRDSHMREAGQQITTAAELDALVARVHHALGKDAPARWLIRAVLIAEHASPAARDQAAPTVTAEQVEREFLYRLRTVAAHYRMLGKHGEDAEPGWIEREARLAVAALGVQP